MSNEERGYCHDWYAKEWDPIFSTNRDFIDYQSYVESRRRPDAEGNNLGIFLQDYEDSVPSCKVEEVEEFCEDTCLDDLKSVDGAVNQLRAAWLDHRSIPRFGRDSEACVREYQNPLSASTLYQLLKEPRLYNGELPHADRRLIYIAHLDPHYIFALTETASFHQVSVLRDAIWKHLALQTSIRVKIPSRRYKIFRLEFQIPYLALRSLPLPADHPQKMGTGKIPRRQWTDLSFLNIQAPKSQGKRQYSMYEAQISLVICGPDEQHWDAYAFVDRYFDGEGLEEDDFSYDGLQEDPIASDLEIDTNLPLVDANLPIWNPREYFLNIVEIRMAQVLKEWEHLVRKVERGVKDYETRISFTLSPGPKTARTCGSENLKETFDCTLQAIELLRKLLAVLSKTIKAWQRFSSNNGDIGYFSSINSSSESDISQRRVRESLFAINETFETLEDLQQSLILLKESCHDSAQALQLRLSHESNETAKYNGVGTEFTVSVISPFALAFAYFSMPQAVIPFTLNFKSFVITIVVAVAVLRLLFFVSRVPFRRSWLWERIAAAPKTMKLDGTMGLRLPSTSECGGNPFTLRRGRGNDSDRTTNATEMYMPV